MISEKAVAIAAKAMRVELEVGVGRSEQVARAMLEAVHALHDGAGDPSVSAPLIRRGEGEPASDPGSSEGSPASSGWQPIETAPKDGTPIEVKGGLGPYSVTSWTGQAAWGVPTNWLKADATWRTPIKGAVLSLAGYFPTHWRPVIIAEQNPSERE